MTAINVLVKPNAIEMLTDGAGYHADGTLGSFGQKAFPLVHLRAVLAGRGPMFFTPVLASRCNEAFASFDDLVSGIAGEARRAVEMYEAGMKPSPFLGGLDLVVAGWSESRDRGELYILLNRDDYGLAAWELTPAHDGYLTPCDGDLLARLGAIGIDPADESLDPVSDGLRIVQEQRARQWPIPGTGHSACIVGGFCQLTRITRDGIASRILERWPDRVGRRIAP